MITELKNLIKLNEFPSIQGTHPVLLEISKIINQLTKSHSNRFYDAILKLKQKTHLRDKIHLINTIEIVREIQRIFSDNNVFYEYSILSDFEDALEYKLGEESSYTFSELKRVFRV